MATLFPPPGPALPPFRSLLVKGDFHTTAPLHLCVTHVLQDDSARAVLLTPSRTRFIAIMKQFNEEWVGEHGGDGRTVNASRRVDMLYPPSPAHLTFLLSLFHEALFDNEQDFVHLKTTFASTPSLIVLCEPSCFFQEDQEATLSSYLTLLLHASSTVSSLSAQSGRTTALAVFDSGLENLRMPLLRVPSPDPDAPEGTQHVVKDVHESVASLAQQYFEWVGTVDEEDSSPPTSQPQEITLSMASRNCILTLQHMKARNGHADVVWQWREELSAGGVVFYW